MGVIGSSGGGYATVNPTQGNPMGEALQNVENSAFKYNAQRTEKAQQEATQQKVIRDAKNTELKENQAYADKNKIPTTGIGSVDKVALDFLIDNKNSYNIAKTTFKNSNNDDEIRNSLETMSNLESSVGVAKALPEMLNASAKDLEEGVRLGKYNPRSSTNAAETIEAMSKGDMKIVLAKNGISTFVTYKRDSQGNLTNFIDKEITLEQLKQKLAPIMNYSSEINNEEFKKGLPKDAQEWEVGNNIYKGYKDIGSLAEQNANAIVTNRDKMYGVAADAGLTPKTNLADYTPEEISKVKDYIKKGLEDKYKPSITTNNAKLNREQTAANQERTQRNSDRDYNYKLNNVEGEGKVRVSTENGPLGKKTTVSESMSKSDFEKKNAEEARVKNEMEKFKSNPSGGFSNDVNKSFKSGDKAKTATKAKETPKQRALRLARQ